MTRHPTRIPNRKIGLTDIAQMVGVQNQTVRLWRTASLAWMRDHPGRPVPTVPTLLPSDAGEPEEKPWWWETDITAWAIQVGRMDPTTLKPRALKRPGRAKGTRNRPKGLASVLALV